MLFHTLIQNVTFETDCIIKFYDRIRVFWRKMESDNSDDVIVHEENITGKRTYTSKGDTPGKPDKKTRRIPRVNNTTSSRALFQSPDVPPKVKYN